MTTRISEVIIEGKPYLIMPRALVEKNAPHLLEEPAGPRIPQNDNIPLEVLDAHLTQDISMMQAWREYLGYTQMDMAERLGISQPTYAKYEKAKNSRRETLEKVAQALDLFSVEQLLED
ncbi:MAG: helix-turn-helix transcriptional regulator [Deinococcota bacterium]